MSEHVEDKLVGWSTIILVFGWFLAVLIWVLGVLAALGNKSIFIFLMGTAIAADVLMVNYFTSRLTLAFADITENTRGANQELQQLNINLQKVYSDDISAADRAQAEKERLEREQAEQRRKEDEHMEAEKRRKAEQRRIEKEQEIARRKEAYWQAHAAEKEVLLAKRTEAEKALSVKGIADKERQELKLLILRIDEELERER